ncbi:MAG: MFS transporter [Acidiferrobacter sp.]
MTTIVVVRKGPIAVIGADTLGTYGDQRESAAFIRNASKLIPVDDTWLAATGHAAMDMALRNIFADTRCRRSFRDVNDIYKTSLDLHATLKDGYFLKLDGEDHEEAFESMQVSLLIANSHGIFGVCSKRTVFEYSKFYAYGSGEQYALGAMHAVYDSDADPEQIARAGLEAAVAFDTGSGAPLELRTLTLRDGS